MSVRARGEAGIHGEVRIHDTRRYHAGDITRPLLSVMTRQHISPGPPSRYPCGTVDIIVAQWIVDIIVQ